jgi:hypothetical protein
MIPHFNPIQPPEPDELPPPIFDNDNASIPSDASPPDSPDPETIDTATTTDEPYSWTLTTFYNPAPLASTSPTLLSPLKTLLLVPLLKKLSLL